MKGNFQRILAVVGLVLIVASIVLMLVGFFAGAAKALLLNISLLCFGASVAVLMFLSVRRRQAEAEKSDDEA